MLHLILANLFFSGDFFTYADREQHYWSGYFTSRPFYKKLDRIVESRLRSAEVAYSMANFLIHSPDAAKQSQWTTVASGLFEKLTQARRNMGLFLHHDGITGTAKVRKYVLTRSSKAN